MSIVVSKVVEPYAEALIDLAKSSGTVKETTNDLKNDESLNELLEQSKAMGLDMYDDGKDIAVEAWVKSKEAAGELTEKAKQKAQEIADEMEQARQAHKEG